MLQLLKQVSVGWVVKVSLWRANGKPFSEDLLWKTPGQLLRITFMIKASFTIFGRSYLPYQQDGHFCKLRRSLAEIAVTNSTLTRLLMQFHPCISCSSVMAHVIVVIHKFSLQALVGGEDCVEKLSLCMYLIIYYFHWWNFEGVYLLRMQDLYLLFCTKQRAW